MGFKETRNQWNMLSYDHRGTRHCPVLHSHAMKPRVQCCTTQHVSAINVIWRRALMRVLAQSPCMGTSHFADSWQASRTKQVAWDHALSADQWSLPGLSASPLHYMLCQRSIVPVAYTYKVLKVRTHPPVRKIHTFLYLIYELFRSLCKTCSCSIVKLVPTDVRF